MNIIFLNTKTNLIRNELIGNEYQPRKVHRPWRSQHRLHGAQTRPAKVKVKNFQDN